jgi:hypothetical protein
MVKVFQKEYKSNWITQFYKNSSTETGEVGNWLFRLNGLNKNEQSVFKTRY